ncbi:MAG: alpha/beta hydrolase, partial [Alphaproteobacteria bacterium]|nr:alpha/beta hydrolase [Alphaproteobacteria bacterium]
LARDAIDMILAFGFSPAAQRGGHPAPGLWLTGSAARLLERTLDGTLAVDLAACNAYRTATADAARVRCPALVLLAETDRLTPPAAAEPLIAALPGNAVVRLPRVGHFMVEEAPDAVIDALRAFLAGAVPAGR